MEIVKSKLMIFLPEEELSEIRETQQKILEILKKFSNNKEAESPRIKNITAMEFMAAVRIRRTKFDQLVSCSKIKTFKKGRKIYVPVSEVERYFTDPSIS